MTLMQGDGSLVWEFVTLLMLVMGAAAIWFFTTVGRDEPSSKQQRGEHTLEQYGDIQEDHAPIGKFIKYTMLVVLLWTVGYAITTGVYGLF